MEKPFAEKIRDIIEHGGGTEVRLPKAEAAEVPETKPDTEFFAVKDPDTGELLAKDGTVVYFCKTGGEVMIANRRMLGLE